MNLFNSTAQIDLSVIDPAEVAKLDDNAQMKLGSLIAAVQRREAATDRWLKAQAVMIDATREQSEALAAHVIANPPPTALEALRANQESYRATHTT